MLSLRLRGAKPSQVEEVMETSHGKGPGHTCVVIIVCFERNSSLKSQETPLNSSFPFQSLVEKGPPNLGPIGFTHFALLTSPPPLLIMESHFRGVYEDADVGNLISISIPACRDVDSKSFFCTNQLFIF